MNTVDTSGVSGQEKVRLDLKLTPAAVKHLKKVLISQNKEALRLSIKRAGCAGLAYDLDYNAMQNEGDIRFFVEGLTLFIEPASVRYLQGTCIDYVYKGLNGALQFLNPNQTASCGCGESFSIEEK
jgi:iron-sulfur cluster assembly protein